MSAVYQRIMGVIEREVQSRNLSDFKNGEMSMTLWACAKYRYPSTVANAPSPLTPHP